MNYLKKDQLRSHLSLKKTVEYWLGKSIVNNYDTIKWIAIEEGREEKGKYYLIYHHVFDDADEGIDTIYDYSYVEPDDLYGIIVGVFDDFDSALDKAVEEYGVELDRFVPEGYIEDFK